MSHARGGHRTHALLHWSFYGLAAGILAAGMAWAKYRFLIFDHAFELYGLLVASLFAALGLWLGWKLSGPKTIVQREVVVREVPVTMNTVSDPPLADATAAGLSAREMDVLRLLCKGHSNAEIAAELFVSLNTVKTHVSSLLFKLDAKRRTQAAERARALGLI